MILCADDRDPKPGKPAIPMPRSVAREGMLGLDLSNYPYLTPFLDEVRALNGVVIKPIDVFLNTMQTILKAYTNQSVPTGALREPLDKAGYEFERIESMRE